MPSETDAGDDIHDGLDALVGLLVGIAVAIVVGVYTVQTTLSALEIIEESAPGASHPEPLGEMFFILMVLLFLSWLVTGTRRALGDPRSRTSSSTTEPSSEPGLIERARQRLTRPDLLDTSDRYGCRHLGWYPFTATETGGESGRCVMCWEETTDPVRSTYGQQLVVFGVVVWTRPDGTVIECDSCHADESDSLTRSLQDAAQTSGGGDDAE